MSEYPLFFETNLIEPELDNIYAGSGNESLDYLSDYNRTTQYASYGSDDTTDEYVIIEFNDSGGSKESRTFDRIILLNTNLKEFKIQSSNWTGSSWTSWADIIGTVFTNNSDNHLIISITELTCWRVRIFMSKTIVTNEEKKIGELILTNLKYECTMPMDVYNIRNIGDVKIQRMYNGTAQKILNYEKYAVSVEFRQITKDERDNLKSIHDEHTAFIWIPEPYDENGDAYKIEECYRVHWVNLWEEQYFTAVKSAGYNVRLRLEEV